MQLEIPSQKRFLILSLDNDLTFLSYHRWVHAKTWKTPLRWWVEEFIDQNVGLIVKTNFKGSSVMDREHTLAYLKKLLERYPTESAQ